MSVTTDAQKRVDDTGTGRSSAGEKRTVRLPAAPVAAQQARREVVSDLLVRDLPASVVEEAEAVVGELVANAVRHAKPLADGSVRVHWKVKNGVVEVEVSDGGGPTVPRPARPTVWGPSGRGLRIVRSIAHEWGVLEDANGRTVWASIGGPSRRRSP
ncbi:MAG TPA: ATP-binding protein [Intrasporangium sp.]|uniref:ATP-binding protein n=1 Tax=Intrasporangium sp. TaxID=1925024 RepID=UPI002D7A3CED|nr:ATP-binding protein [Intrasporangium sp.]HET7397229.1 ATP-binding protein [Intrasporangium sp.]